MFAGHPIASRRGAADRRSAYTVPYLMKQSKMKHVSPPLFVLKHWLIARVSWPNTSSRTSGRSNAWRLAVGVDDGIISSLHYLIGEKLMSDADTALRRLSWPGSYHVLLPRSALHLVARRSVINLDLSSA